MTENQQTHLQQVLAFVRFSVVLAHLRRAEEVSEEGGNRNHPENVWFEEFEKHFDVRLLFSRSAIDPDSRASEILKAWFRGATPLEAWAMWLSGNTLTQKHLAGVKRRNTSKSNLKKEVAYAILPSLHQIKPFSGDAYPHNMVARFKAFLGSPDEERKTGKEHGEPTHHLLRWGDYALELVELNGGWKQFANRTSRGIQSLDDFWPSRDHPRTTIPAADANSFIRRVIALSRDRYLQVIVPPTAVAWPLWLLRTLHDGRTNRDATGESLVHKMQEIRKHGDGSLKLKALVDGGTDGKSLFLDLSLRPGELRGLPYPFGEAERALEQVRSAFNLVTPDCETVWELEWFTPLCNQLFPKRDRVQGCPPILVYHRADAQGPGMSRYILATEPCQHFATIFAAGEVDRHKYFVCCQSGTWAEAAAKRLKATDKFILSRDRFITKCISTLEDRNPGLYLSSFPSDVFLRAQKSPLRRKDLYRLDLDESDLEELDYLLPGAAFFGGEHLVFQPKMLPLLRDFGRLLIECARVVRTCIPGLSSRDVLRYICVAPDSRIEHTNALAAVCSTKIQSVLPANDRAHEFLRTLLTSIGLAIGEYLIPEPLRAEYNEHIKKWGWAHLLELTFYTNVSFGEALTLIED